MSEDKLNCCENQWWNSGSVPLSIHSSECLFDRLPKDCILSNILFAVGLASMFHKLWFAHQIGSCLRNAVTMQSGNPTQLISNPPSSSSFGDWVGQGRWSARIPLDPSEKGSCRRCLVSVSFQRAPLEYEPYCEQKVLVKKNPPLSLHIDRCGRVGSRTLYRAWRRTQLLFVLGPHSTGKFLVLQS
jgi:hypothetical protein